MFCDANGRPNPDGDYQLINGNMILRDGRSARLNIMLMDGQAGRPPSSQCTSAQVSDVQVTTFRDSPAGKEFLALLRNPANASHPQHHALTADQEADAVRQHLARPASHTMDTAAIEVAQAREATAYAACDPNAWRRA